MKYSKNTENITTPFSLPLEPPALIRTHRAYCKCGNMSTSYDPNIRITPCLRCKKIIVIQKYSRGFLVRKKLRKLKKKESIYRWFVCNNINGKDLSILIGSFLFSRGDCYREFGAYNGAKTKRNKNLGEKRQESHVL